MDSVQIIADEVREQNRLFESGDTDKAFWLGQQNRLKAMKTLDPSLTQTQIGEMVGKGRRWVQVVIAWEAQSNALPDWGNKPQTERNTSTAKTVVKNRNQRKALIDSLSDDEKVALVESVVKTPDIVEKVMAKNTKASKAIRRVTVDVEEREAKERFKRNKEAAIQRQKPTNLSLWFHRITVKISEWANDLATIRSNIDDLLPEQVPLMIEAHERLIESARRNVDIMKGDAESDVIEGKVVDITTKALRA